MKFLDTIASSTLVSAFTTLTSSPHHNEHALAMPPNSQKHPGRSVIDVLATPQKGLKNERGAKKTGGGHVNRQALGLPRSFSPGSWTAMTLGLISAGLAYELKLQRDLTRPPVVFGQLPRNTLIRKVYDELTSTPTSILTRPIKPSLLVGTRAQLASAVAFMARGPSHQPKEFERFREIFTMAADGAQIAVDWEVPVGRRKGEILHDKKIRHPVIIILHGINNHSEFGYMKSLQRTFCRRGWNAAAVNFRGCGGSKMTTPRGYTAAYTGDLRSLVLQISSRMQDGARIFLVGNSLGANLVTKYLGEEGLSGTLPGAVAGGVSLGNPILFRSNHIEFPHNILIGMARKKTYWEHREAVSSMNDAASLEAKRAGIRSHTLGQLDRAASSLMIRNDAFPPYALRIGYNDTEDYWQDSGCYHQSRFVSVPFMHVAAQDDFLCYHNSLRLIAYALSNPNIMVVETRCGGHLGWQEARKHTSTWFGMDCWADEATADFIQAILSHTVPDHTILHSKL